MPIVNPTGLLRSEYELTLDAYYGYGMFAHGGALTSFGREVDFATRQSMSAYNNLLKPMVDAKVDPVFIDEPARTFNDDAIVEGFLENSDNNGTSLKQIIKHAVLETELVGNSFIIMDNFPDSDIPETLSDIVEQRMYPYVYSKSVLDVYEYGTDVFNKLEYITFYYGVYADGENDELLYKRFTKKDIEYFVIKKKKNENGEVVSETRTLSLTNHTLGVVPVAYYDKDVLPFAPYYSMSTMLRRLYNLDSEIADLGRAQMFSILLIPSITGGDGPQDNITISTSNALFFDSNATQRPDYISPDSSIMTVQLKQRNEYYDSIIQQANILGTKVGNTSVSKSGIAYAFEFFGRMQELRHNADVADVLEGQLIAILGAFMGIYIEYEVSYPNTFSPTFNETDQKVNLLIKVQDLEISDLVTANVQGDIVALVGEFMQWSDEKIAKSIDSVSENLLV